MAVGTIITNGYLSIFQPIRNVTNDQQLFRGVARSRNVSRERA